MKANKIFRVLLSLYVVFFLLFPIDPTKYINILWIHVYFFLFAHFRATFSVNNIFIYFCEFFFLLSFGWRLSSKWQNDTHALRYLQSYTSAELFFFFSLLSHSRRWIKRRNSRLSQEKLLVNVAIEWCCKIHLQMEVEYRRPLKPMTTHLPIPKHYTRKCNMYEHVDHGPTS